MIGSLLFLALVAGSDASFKFITIGDWGTHGSQDAQIKVAENMNEYCEENQVEFLVSTGDNIYNDGVTSPDDPLFQDRWHKIYHDPPELTNLHDMVWIMSFGNHDHGPSDIRDGREMYQVEFGETEPRWYHPERYYSYVHEQDGVRALFIISDSQALRHNKEDPEAQYQFIDDQLEWARDPENEIDWTFHVAHHPPYSGGQRTGSGTMRNVLDQLDAGLCDISLWGHEHNLQHITWASGGNDHHTEIVTSGGGGRPTYGLSQEAVDFLEAAGYSLEFFIEDQGFVAVDVQKEEIIFDYYDLDNELVYSFNHTKSN